MALTILAKISLSNNSPFFSLGTEVRGTNTKSYRFPVSFFFFSSGPSPATKTCLTLNGQRPSFLSPLSPSHTFFFPLRSELGFLFLHTLAWQLLCQLLPAPTPQPGVGHRRAKVHFPKCALFTFWQVKCKGTQTSQSHSIQTAHWKTQNPVSKSLSFAFQVLILTGFEFCSYSVIFTKSGLRTKMFSFCLFVFCGEGLLRMSFNVHGILSLEVPFCP